MIMGDEMKTSRSGGISPRLPIARQEIQSVVEQIVRRFQPEKIILFGSHASGSPRPESDVDLLVIMETELRNHVQAVVIAQAIDYRFGLDLLVRRPKQVQERIDQGDSFLGEILRQVKVVYARTH